MKSLNKRIFFTECAYALGLAGLAMGTALMEAADFGVSMVVAPAYLVYLKLSQTLGFFTFGMAEYTLQAVLLIVLTIVLRRFRISWLFSIVTAVLYGFLLDGAIALVSLFAPPLPAFRLAAYLLGMLLCSAGFRSCSIPTSRRRYMSCLSRSCPQNTAGTSTKSKPVTIV